MSAMGFEPAPEVFEKLKTLVAQKKKEQTLKTAPPNRVPIVIDPKTRVGRNDPCPCGSGKKYKKCCLNK